jgi:hypothetical protein
VNWQRVDTFCGWLLACIVLTVFVYMLATYGDCFEIEQCWEFKRIVHRPIIAGGVIVWLIGIAYLFRRWFR